MNGKSASGATGRHARSCPGVWPMPEEAREAPALGLECVDRETCRSCDRRDGRRGTGSRRPSAASHVSDEIERQAANAPRWWGAVQLDGCQARYRTPATILADAPGGAQRQRATVAGHGIAIGRQAGHLHLHALDRRVDVANGTARRALLAHHVPRLERMTHFELDAARLEVAVLRKAELEVRREPRAVDGKAGRRLLREDVVEILLDEVRQHEAIVQLGAPARQPPGAIRFAPEARDERCEAAAAASRLMRACGGISNARSSSRPRRPVAAVGRIELVDAELGAMRVAGHVDEQVAEQRDRRSHGGVLAPPCRCELPERDLEFVQRVVARLVDARRLRGRSDEQAREQIRERRMVVPVARAGSAADRAGAGTASRARVAPPSTKWLPPPVPV